MSSIISKNLQVGTSGTATDNFTIFQPATPDGTLRIGNGNTGITTSQVALTSAGNVGIGTSSPTAQVEVSRSSTSGYSTFRLSNSGASGKTYEIGVGGNAAASGYANNLYFYDSTAGVLRMSIGPTGNLQFNSGYGSAATAYGCRAWVNFNGTGTVAIRASGNVSSITDNGTGDYTVNFTTAMPDANYAPVATGELNGGAMSICVNQTLTASAWNLRIRDNAGNNIDSSITTASVFR